MEPRISILLPTYNGSRTIARAIESVQAQTFVAWELLVLDDGSTDTTSEVVAGFVAKDERIRYIKNNTNLGIQKTLGRGLREAKGDYIARIDDDDFWIIPYKLSAQYAYVQLHPDCVLIGTGVIVYDEHQQESFRYLLPETDAEIRETILSKNCFTHSTVLFSKSVALELGGYGEGEDTKHVEDYDLWLRMGQKGTLQNLPLYAVGFTLRDQSVSAEHKRDQFKKDIALTKKYKSHYPGYARAYIRGMVRMFLASTYSLFTRLPDGIQHKIMQWYKKYW